MSPLTLAARDSDATLAAAPDATSSPPPATTMVEPATELDSDTAFRLAAPRAVAPISPATDSSASSPPKTRTLLRECSSNSLAATSAVSWMRAMRPPPARIRKSAPAIARIPVSDTMSIAEPAASVVTAIVSGCRFVTRL